MASLDTADMLAKEMCSVPTEAQTSASGPSSSPASGPSSRPMDDLEAVELLLYFKKSVKSSASPTPKDDLAAAHALLRVTKSQTSEPRIIKALPKRSNLAPPRIMVTRSMQDDVPTATPASVQKPLSSSTTANQEGAAKKKKKTAPADGEENSYDAATMDRIAREEIAALSTKRRLTPSEGRVKCKACYKRYPNNRHDLTRHYTIHLFKSTRPFKCGTDGCDIATVQKSNLEKHCQNANHVYNY